MTSKTILYSSCWVLSCGAAFYFGRSGSQDEPENQVVETTTTTQTRTISRSTTSSGSSNAASRLRTGDLRSEESLRTIDNLLALSDPIERTQGFIELVNNLGPGQFLEVVDYYRSFGVDDEQFGEYSILLTAWAKVDPMEALTYASENTRGPFARQTILASWAKEDTASAIAWAKENFDGSQNRRNPANPWLIGVIKGVVSQDLPKATELLQELPFSRGRSEALDHIFSELNRNGVDATKQWISKLDDETLQAGAAARLADKLAETDPREAIEWVENLGEEALKRSADDIVEQWVKTDLTEAQTWVDSQSKEIASAAGPELIDAMIDQKGAVAASDWLSQHEGDSTFDRTVQTFAWNVMSETPELGADWVMKITDERRRTRTFHRLIGDWLENDLEGAANYAENNPVPEGIQMRVRRKVEEVNETQ